MTSTICNLYLNKTIKKTQNTGLCSRLPTGTAIKHPLMDAGESNK